MEEKEPKTDEAEVPAEEVEQKAENGDALAEEKPKEPAEKKPAEEPAEKTEEQPLEYKPPSPPKKRKRRRKQKNQMGVGGILDFARIRFGNGLREWEVEQDDHGRFTFDGEELSFDMWAQMNQTGEDGVFRAEVPIPPQRRRKPKMLYDYEGPSTNGTKKAEKRKKPPKEKDEGELSDSDDHHASSSSSSSDSDGEGGARRRRKQKRTAAPSTSAAMASIFKKAYEFRSVLVHHLSLSQKTALLNSLRETPSL